MSNQARPAKGQPPKTARSVRGRLPSGEPNPVDVHLGRRLRLRRILLGISQEELGAAIGLTFQQIQKYEYGLNRVGTSRLWDLSRALGCPVSFFFEEMNEKTAEASPRKLLSEDLDLSGLDAIHANVDAATRREALLLVRAYSTIRQPEVRRKILELASSLGGVPSDKELA